MKIIIEPASNGARMTVNEGDRESVPVHSVHNYDEDDLRGLQVLLFELVEHIGVDRGRHSRERIIIKIEHGDKYECTDPKCLICHDDIGS